MAPLRSPVHLFRWMRRSVSILCSGPPNSKYKRVARGCKRWWGSQPMGGARDGAAVGRVLRGARSVQAPSMRSAPPDAGPPGSEPDSGHVTPAGGQTFRRRRRSEQRGRAGCREPPGREETVMCTFRFEILWGVAKLAVAWIVPAGPALAGERQRVALVVGNAAYEHAAALRNPGNDATGVAAALAALDYEVIQALNVDRDGLFDKLDEFTEAARGADVALFFYAGHGLQADCKRTARTIRCRWMRSWRRNCIGGARRSTSTRSWARCRAPRTSCFSKPSGPTPWRRTWPDRWGRAARSGPRADWRVWT